MRALAAILFAALAGAVQAQEWITVPPSRPTAPGAATSVPGAALPGQAITAPGGTLRVLDKINGTVTDLDLRNGETQEVGLLTVTMGECRAPADNPAGDAFALVSIRTKADETAIFEGWMIASAPALNAMDHPRYDAWALRCTGVSAPAPAPEGEPEGNDG